MRRFTRLLLASILLAGFALGCGDREGSAIKKQANTPADSKSGTQLEPAPKGAAMPPK